MSLLRRLPLLTVLVVTSASACAHTEIRTERLDQRRWLISGHGNEYTTTANVSSELHRTAANLCPAGYRVEDSAAGTDRIGSIDLVSKDRHESSTTRPSGTTVIECKLNPVEARVEVARGFDRTLLDRGARAHATGPRAEELVIVSPRCGSGLLDTFTDLAALREVEFRTLACSAAPGGPALERVDLWQPRDPAGATAAAAPALPLE